MRYAIRPAEGGHRYALAMQEIQMAEALGFDGAFFGEHHGLSEYWPSPLMSLAAAARVTRKIRLGTSVLLPLLYNPIRLAEEVAMLDGLSEGRLIVGMGMGWSTEEFEAFQVPSGRKGQRFTEAVRVMKALWTTDPAHFRGEFFRLAGYVALPRPFQTPHPPIWLGGSSTEAIRRAADLGDAWVRGDFETISDLAQGWISYQRFLGARSQDQMKKVSPGGRHIVLDRSRRRAWTEAEAYFSRTYRPFEERGHAGVISATREGVEQLVRNRHIVGDPSECAEIIRRLREEAGIDYLILKFSRRASLDEFASQVRLFADEVIPRV